MFLLAADGGDAVTIGLGVIAGALFFGEFAFFKWIHGPALERADKQITAAEERHKEEVKNFREVIRRLEEKSDRQNSVLEEKALPALIAATTTVSQSHQLMEAIRAEQEHMIRERELEEARQDAIKNRSAR